MFYGGSVSTPKPAAMMMKNWTNLMSLGNSYASTANLTDIANAPTFTPAYTGTGFSVSGLTNPGESGSTLIMAKSDGSTMIAVWREPQIDNGANAGSSQVPGVNNVTVNLGSSQAYKVWDPSGGSGGNNLTVTAAPTLIKSGTGSSLSLALYGVPMLIELGSTGNPASFVPPTVGTVNNQSPNQQTSIGHVIIA
jgi:hypothetical protein